MLPTNLHGRDIPVADTLNLSAILINEIPEMDIIANDVTLVTQSRIDQV